MARPRRRRVRVRVRTGPQVDFEWIGFRSGGLAANLNVQSEHEIMPPNLANTVGVEALTVVRVVGMVAVRQQAGVITTSAFGWHLGVWSVGGDQTIDDLPTAVSTDIDDIANKRIMHWQTYQRPAYGSSIADADEIPFLMPFDIKVRRRITKRETLLLLATASDTARLRLSVDCRVLISHIA